MNILVTGATGFIGGHLVKALVKKTGSVRCLVRKEAKVKDLKKLKVDVCRGNVLDKNSLIRATKNVDLVFHLVGIGSITDDSLPALSSYQKINVGGTKNLLEASEKNKIKGFVHFSSLAAQGVIPDKVVTETTPSHPQTPYERSKHQSELVVKRFRKKRLFPITIIRPALVYGPGAKSSDVLVLARLIKKRFCPVLGHAKNILPLVYVKDLVRATANLADRKKIPNKAYNITRESPVRYKDFVDSVRKAMNAPCLFIHVPIGVATLGAYLLKFISLFTQGPPILTPKRVNSITANRLYDVSLVQKDLDFHSSPFFQTIKETINWYQANQSL